MTQKAAICIALLKGEVLSIMTGYVKFQCTNVPREISRGIEQPFGVEISRDPVSFNSKWDNKPGVYYRYRLNRTEANAAGIKMMEEYVQKQSGEKPSKKTKEYIPQSKQLF